MVSIIIPVHNQLNLLNACLLSIWDKTKSVYEVIISDSNSDRPANENYYNEAMAQGLINKIVYDSHPGGFSRAINSGMKVVSDDSEYIVWLNSDTIIGSYGWLDLLKEPFKKYSDTVATGPISNSASYQTFIHCNNIDANIEKVSSLLNSFNPEYPLTKLLNGFCVMIKRSAILKTGYVDEVGFPHYGSEDDYFVRMKGDKRVVSDCFVFHHGKRSYGKARTSMTRTAAEALHTKYPKISELIMFTEVSLSAEKNRVLKHILSKIGTNE